MVQETDEIIENLKIVYQKIRNKTPKTKEGNMVTGFCHLISELKIFDGELEQYFKEEAKTTDYISKAEIEKAKEKYKMPIIIDETKWLFAPMDWKSRRRWLKNVLKEYEKQE